MGQMKTPGVYIVEKNAFPNSIVEVATAVPAFIGHTEKAVNGKMSLEKKPWRITSMAEYHQYFGEGPEPKFDITEVTVATDPADVTLSKKSADVTPKRYKVTRSAPECILYYCMLLFYQNGGGPCYIVSVGGYGDAFDKGKMTKGIDTLIKEQEPTMVVIPEAIKLDADNCFSVQKYSLMHCGYKMKNRVAILDVFDGNLENECIEKFRTGVGKNNLDFASAYYPWINTTILQEKDVSFLNLTDGGNGREALKTILEEEFTKKLTPEEIEKVEARQNALTAKRKDLKSEGLPDESEEIKKIDLELNIIKNVLTKAGNEKQVVPPDVQLILNKIPDTKDGVEAISLSNTLLSISKDYATLVKEMTRQLNLLPPGAAMAGVYTMVDNSRGVWKAPANVSLNSVVSPAVTISHDEQQDLNVPLDGKSINAIRAFIGEGVLVWGARTLDGNSLDWRYINVRRTMIMLEESIRIASKAYVFENNNANTWSTMKSMIGNFLHGIWKRGGLAGTKPEDAYAVFAGLGETMTPEDILEGILRITVLVAVTRPAEFIEITFQQQMQKS